MEGDPKMSPDGKWFAYTSNESGDSEIYVRPFPEVDTEKQQISNGGGSCPLWSPDGRELFYLSTANDVMAVPVKTEPSLSLGKPECLFRSMNVARDFGKGNPWDIHPKDKRFLMMKEVVLPDKPAAAEAPQKINIVVNWFDELKQRVPVK